MTALPPPGRLDYDRWTAQQGGSSLRLRDTTPHRIRRPCLRYILISRLYECKHCGKTYRTKRSALDHDCEAMK